MFSLPQIIPGQMQWILFLLLLFINSMEMLTQARRKKRVSVALFENCTGCVMCSEDNGCTACQQRLFLLFWRDGIRQYGACVHACPPGYFGLRGQELNRCSKCRSPSCESCFSRDFCMKCKERFFLHKGRCFSACPPETLAQSSTRECQEKCEMGPWGNWSPCTNQGRTCGCKWGMTTRVREVIRSSKEESATCPTLSESKKCRMKKRCPGEKNEKKRKGRREMKHSGQRSIGPEATDLNYMRKEKNEKKRKGKREKKEKKKKKKMDSLMVT